MRRSPIKLGILLGGLAVASLPGRPAEAQNPTTTAPVSTAPAADVRARMWAATARFVYGDDPELASLRPQLRQTIDSSSVKAFGRHLEDAVKLENKSLPQLKHVLKFQGDFKTLSARNEQPGALATSIANRLRDNKPERQNQAAFGQLRQTLHDLADPNAPQAVATPAAPLPAGTDSATESATAPDTTPAAGSFTITPSPTSPMLTYLPLVLSILSLLVALVALMKSSGSKRRHHQHSSSAPTLTSLTDEMRAEVRTIVQREVSNKVPGARPAAEAPAPPRPAVAKNAPTLSVKESLAKAAQPKAPAPVATAPPLAEPATSSEPTEPVAAPAAEAEDVTANYPVEEAAVAPPTRTLYANQQPIDGIFQRNMLAESPASYTIFELTTAADAPDQARFVVTSNPAGHAGYIGSHVNILGGACDYPFPKGGVSRIVTDVPGVAHRTAGGDWQISQKAQIHFE